MRDNLILRYKDVLTKLTSTGFFHVFSSTILIKIISFFSGIILVRILTKSEYGIYSYSTNILNLFLIISGLGTMSGILQLSSESNNPQIKLSVYRYGSTIGILFNCCLSILIVITALFIPLPITGANSLLLFMGAIPIINLLNDYQNIYLRTNMENKKFAYNNTIHAVLLLAFSVAGSFLFQARGLVLFQIISNTIALLIAWKILGVPISIGKVNLDKNLKKILLSISLISMVNNGLSSLLNIMDVFIIGIIIQNEEILASYAIASIIPSTLSFIPVALITYIYPYFAKNKDNKSWVLINYKKVLIGIGILNLCITVFLVVFAPLIVSLLFGKQYMDTIDTFRILAIGYFFSGTFREISGNLLVTQRKLKFNLNVAIISGVLTIIFDIIFISVLGTIGAAIAKVLIILITAILNTGYMFYILKYKN